MVKWSFYFSCFIGEFSGPREVTSFTKVILQIVIYRVGVRSKSFGSKLHIVPTTPDCCVTNPTVWI